MRFHEILEVNEHSKISDVQNAYKNKVNELKKIENSISPEIYMKKMDEINKAKADCEDWINSGTIQKFQKRVKESANNCCNPKVLHSAVIGPCTFCDVYIAPKCCNDQDQFCCGCCPCCYSGETSYCNYCCGDCCDEDCGPCSANIMPLELDILIYVILAIGLIKYIYGEVKLSKKINKKRKIEEAKKENQLLIEEKESAESKIVQLKEILSELENKNKQTDIFLDLFHSIEPSVVGSKIKSNELENLNRVNLDVKKEENNLILINQRIEENNKIIEQDE